MVTKAPEKKKVISGWAFHCHHDTLYEWVTDYKERVNYIKEAKPFEERELRLRLFKMIPDDRIPFDLFEAKTKWYEAETKWYEAETKWEEAKTKWEEAETKWEEAKTKREEAETKREEAKTKWYEAETKWYEAKTKREEAETKREEAETKWYDYFIALHTELCPNCLWDGKTIFPTKEV